MLTSLKKKNTKKTKSYTIRIYIFVHVWIHLMRSWNVPSELEDSGERVKREMGYSWPARVRIRSFQSANVLR